MKKIGIRQGTIDTMIKIGMEDFIIDYWRKQVGTIYPVYDTWEDQDGTKYATIDLCVEIPIEGSELFDE